MRFILLLLIFASFSSETICSDALRVEKLSFEKGVSHHMVYSIIQDKFGYMWFGTMYGLIRYDGINYKKYRHDPKDTNSLSNDDIVSMCEDSDGNLWIGTYGRGLNFYDRAKNKFIRFGIDHFDSIKNWDGVIWDIVTDDRGNLWFATRTSGVVKLNIKTFNYEIFDDSVNNDESIADNYVTTLYYDEHLKELYVGTHGNILHNYNYANNTFNKMQVIVEGDSNYIVLSLDAPTDSTLLIGTQRGLIKFNKRNQVFSKLIMPDNALPEKISVRQIINDPVEKEIWLATQIGVIKINLSKNEVDRIHRNHSDDKKQISSNDIIALYKDYTGVYWVGSYLGGIYKILTSPSQIVHVQYQHDGNNLSSKIVNDFEQTDSSAIWIATANGLNKFVPSLQSWQVIKRTNSNNSLNSNYITSLAKDANNNLWIGTARGLNKVNLLDNSLQSYYNHTGLPSRLKGFITAIEPDDLGNVLIGTNDGLFIYRSETDRFYRFDYEITGNNILSIFIDSQNYLWTGTFRGLNKTDMHTGETKLFEQDPGNINSISNNYVYSMIEDDEGRVWIGTGGGLNLYNREKNTFTYYTEQEGLSSSVIAGILSDGKGNLWISTNMGITKFNFVNTSFMRYDTRDELQSNMFRNNSCLVTADGKLLFGGINGFNIIDPHELMRADFIPKTMITSISSMGNEVVPRNDLLELNYNENFVSISFAVLDYNKPFKNKYKILFDGLNDNWVNTNESSIEYNGLVPGKYTFKLLGANSFGTWSEKPYELSIIVHPPFWRTYWFYGLILLVIILFLAMYHRSRIRNEIRRRVELEKIRAVENDKVRKKAAADFHDELGHRITKISLFSEILKQNSTKLDNESLTYLDKISEMTKGLSSGVRDFIWTLDPAKDSLYEVAVRLKDFGDELFDKTGVSFTVEGISTEFEKVRLSMDWRRHITLMFKEAMNNALKYANAKNVLLSFALDNKLLRLSLIDDGLGITNKSSRGRGLSNISERAKSMNSELNIFTDKVSGTEIRFEGNVV